MTHKWVVEHSGYYFVRRAQDDGTLSPLLPFSLLSSEVPCRTGNTRKGKNWKENENDDQMSSVDSRESLRSNQKGFVSPRVPEKWRKHTVASIGRGVVFVRVVRQTARHTPNPTQPNVFDISHSFPFSFHSTFPPDLNSDFSLFTLFHSPCRPVLATLSFFFFP